VHPGREGEKPMWFKMVIVIEIIIGLMFFIVVMERIFK
jgi:hypothetical protein